MWNKYGIIFLILLLFISFFGFIGFRVYAAPDAKFQVVKVNLPPKFLPLQWNEDGWVVGLLGDKLIRYQPEMGVWKVIFPHVWSSLTDSKGEWFAFSNENGLQYAKLGDSKSLAVIDPDPELRIHLCSPNGRYLLYSRLDGCFSEYFIYDRMSGEIQSFQFKNVENFLSEPLAWKNVDGKDQLIFILRFSASKTGEKKYRSAGYRASLYRANIDGEFIPLVDSEDGQFLIFDGFSLDGEKGYYHFFSEEGKIREVDLRTGESSQEWTFENVRSVSLAEEENLALVERDSLELLDLNKNEILYKFRFEYKRMIWSPDHRKILILPSIDSDLDIGYLIQIQ